MPQLRHAIRDFAQRGGVPEPPLADVCLAVSEAVSNSVLHAYRDDPRPGSVEVAADLRADELRLIVSDDGGGPYRRDDSPGAGLGLGLIRKVADECDLRERTPKGTELRLRFKLAS